VAAPLNCKSKRAVERWQLVLTQTLGLAFAKAHSRHPHTVLYLVFERHRIAPKVQPPRQRLQPLSRPVVNQPTSIENDPAPYKTLPAGYTLQLFPHSDSQLVVRHTGQRATGTAPKLVNLCQGAAEALLVWMSGFALDHGLGEHVPGGRLKFTGDLPLNRLRLGLEIESEVTQPALDHQALLFSETT
jgi:hypothetical protein